MPVIGFLNATSGGASIAFLQGLKETGYVEGTWRSNAAGRKVNSIGCRRLQPISSAAA
jgi:hypothetical protein